MLAPLIGPQIVYALGLYRFYATLHLLDTYAGVIAAHAAIGLPFVMLIVGAALVNFDIRLERAARNLGATPTQALRRVLIPNIRTGIISGAVFAFIASWDELIIVLFIAKPQGTHPAAGDLVRRQRKPRSSDRCCSGHSDHRHGAGAVNLIARRPPATGTKP